MGHQLSPVNSKVKVFPECENYRDKPVLGKLAIKLHSNDSPVILTKY